MLNSRLAFEPYVLEGFDHGYASDEYSGANHTQIGLDYTFRQFNEVSIIGTIAHTWLAEEVKQLEGREDVTWATPGIAVEF